MPMPTMPSLLDDASLPTDPQGLADQLAEVEKRMQACQAEIQRLMRAEDPGAGVFHAAAIHQAKQLLMMLRYQKDLRSARLNQLRAFSSDEEMAP